MLSKTLPLTAAKGDKRDQVFNLPLTTVVEGRDAEGLPFKEKTALFYISHQGAAFGLSRPVMLGTKLRMVVDLPPNLAADKNLKLVIRGEVALVEELTPSPFQQRVSVRFETKYFIKEEN